MSIPRIFIGATSGESGKTTISIGILAALRKRGKRIASFKKGPDFIDPMWLSAASGRPCRNLDKHLFSNEICSQFQKGTEGAQIALIEGNHGLFDSIDVEGEGSSARLAQNLNAPVILVVPAAKATRSLAPLIRGFAGFEPEVHIAGIIFNRVAGARHEQRIREVMERYCDIPVLGYIYRTKESPVKQRYLGLVPEEEASETKSTIELLGKMIEESVDLDKLLQIAEQAPPLEIPAGKTGQITGTPNEEKPTMQTCTIAIARDRAFHFYYRENLEALQRRGATLVEFSPINDPELPQADALYLGGGFPELFARELSQNTSMLQSVRKAAENRMPIYAECGGMIYLSQSIRLGSEEKFPLAGVLKADVAMSSRPHGRGYIAFETCSPASPVKTTWEIPPGMEVKAHEFHYSAFTTPVDPGELIYQLQRGEGIAKQKDGWLSGSVLASYAHIHSLAAPWWAEIFCKTASKYRQQRLR